MSDIEPEDILAETELVHWSPRRGPLIGSGPAHTPPEFPAPAASPALAIGALAVGAWSAPLEVIHPFCWS